MDNNSQSGERRPEEYVLFAITCAGLGTASGGLILSLPSLAIAGVVLTLVGLLAFSGRAKAED